VETLSWEAEAKHMHGATHGFEALRSQMSRLFASEAERRICVICLVMPLLSAPEAHICLWSGSVLTFPTLCLSAQVASPLVGIISLHPPQSVMNRGCVTSVVAMSIRL
jgi:hypothetical protein